ncbi:hypothetical protein OQA88_7373 [Cercophora sp. LCS_1]
MPSPRRSVSSPFRWSLRSSQSTLTANSVPDTPTTTKADKEDLKINNDHVKAKDEEAPIPLREALLASVYATFGLPPSSPTPQHLTWDILFRSLFHRNAPAIEIPITTLPDKGIAVIRSKCRIIGFVASVSVDLEEVCIDWTTICPGRTTESIKSPTENPIRVGDAVIAINAMGRPVIVRMHGDYATLVCVMEGDDRLWYWELEGGAYELTIAWRCMGFGSGQGRWADEVVEDLGTDRTRRAFHVGMLLRDAGHFNGARERFGEVVSSLGGRVDGDGLVKGKGRWYKGKKSHAMNLVDLFMRDGPGVLQYAAKYGLLEVVKLLMSLESAALYEPERRRAAFVSAAKRRHVQIARLLLAPEDNLWSAINGHQESFTPLMLAVMRNDRSAIEDELDIGDVDLDARDDQGMTALVWALRARNRAAVNLLLDTGRVSLNTKDNYRLSPMAWAAVCGGEWYVQRLLDAKRDTVWWRRRKHTEPTYSDRYEHALFG